MSSINQVHRAPSAASETQELRELRASLPFTRAGIAFDEGKKPGYVVDVERLLKLQGAKVTRDGNRLTFVPLQEGEHGHPFNRLASALKALGNAELNFDPDKTGRYFRTADEPARLFLGLEAICAGKMDAATAMAFKAITGTNRPQAGGRSLWATNVANWGESKGLPAPFDFSHVRSQASALAVLAADVRRAVTETGELTEPGWQAAAKIPPKLVAVESWLRKLEALADHHLEAVDATGDHKDRVTPLERGSLAYVEFPGQQMRVHAGPVPLKRSAIRDSGRQVLEATRQAASELLTQLQTQNHQSDPVALAVGVADLCRLFDRAERQFRGEDVGEFQHRTVPTKPNTGRIQSEGGPRALAELRGAFDYSVASFQARTGDLQSVVAAASAVLRAQGVMFEVTGNTLTILPGEATALNRRAGTLNLIGSRLIYDPTLLRDENCHGMFKPSTREVFTSHASIREERFDTLNHETEHAMARKRYDSGASIVWDGRMTSKNRTRLSSSAVNAAYREAFTVNEVVAHLWNAVTLLQDAQSAFAQEGTSSPRAFELAADARVYLLRAGILADQVVSVVDEVRPQLESTPPAISSLEDAGVIVDVVTPRVSVKRALGDIPGTVPDIQQATKDSLDSLRAEANHASVEARRLGSLENVSEMLDGAARLLALLRAEQK